MKRILVIGATGNIGRPVVSELIANGVDVRALTRDLDSANLPGQAEPVKGDITNPATLDPALRNVDAVFLVWRAPAASPAITRIAKSARRIVFLSAPHRTAHPLFQQPNPMAALHAEIERQIEALSVEWTFLRPGIFALNAISW